MGFVKVAESEELQPGQCQVIVVGGKELALFNVAGTFYCLDNECPHAGGPLGEGYLDQTAVICPWHGWCFNVTTGEGMFGLGINIPSHACKIEEGAVWVDI